MRKLLRFIGIILAGLVALVLAAVVILYFVGGAKWKRSYENFHINAESISVLSGEEAVAQGKHIATIHFCGLCHGDDLAGKVFLDAPLLAVAYAPNLTPGAGGVGATNTDEDWVRAIRHGVGHDGRGLVAMPARIWYILSDSDLGSLIAYLKSLPPVDNQLPERRIGPLGRVIVALGVFPLPEAALIDHSAPRPPSPDPGETVSYGEYLVRSSCTACHGQNLEGGYIRGTSNSLVLALNLTPGGELRGWTQEVFAKTLRSGVTPAGRTLSEAMPWRYVGQMTDEEIGAVWMFLQSLPALEQGLERTDR